MCNTGRQITTKVDAGKVDSTWLLVSWVGCIPESFEIVKCSDVYFDNVFTPDCVLISSFVMIKCGRIKSPAVVMHISENKYILKKELAKLRSDDDQENVDPTTNKNKKPKWDRLSMDIVKEESPKNDKLTQAKKTIQELTKENQRLKAELYEANKLINTICSNLKTVVSNAHNRLQDEEDDDEDEELPSRRVDDVKKGRYSDVPYCPVEETENEVLIGSNHTSIPQQDWMRVNWCSHAAATRKLLMSVFPREVLATHTLTGKPSPAFLQQDMPQKDRLNPLKVSDIIEVVMYKCGVNESNVRSAITTKCADENKMYKKRLEKNKQ